MKKEGGKRSDKHIWIIIWIAFCSVVFKQKKAFKSLFGKMSEEKKADEVIADFGKKVANRGYVIKEGEYIEAYKAYEKKNDFESASNLRKLVSDKFYGGDPDIGHYNAQNFPYTTGEIPLNEIGKLLGVPPPLTGDKNAKVSTKFKKSK